MSDFVLSESDVHARVRRARERVAAREAFDRLPQARGGGGLEAEDAVLLWLDGAIDTEVLWQLARELRAARQERLETFSPLYMTNTCDAECRMCGMRRDNDALRRETAPIEAVEDQLRVLQRRGMNAVSLLTGEYRRESRAWAIPYVNRALRAAQDLGFSHVLINVGSIDAAEFETLLDGIARDGGGRIRPKLTMCTFQETYSRDRYRRFMGADDENPRADFDRRLTNFDRSFQAGMRVANPGVLLGLNPDLAFELLALVSHARHLRQRGMEVYLSVPRLRQIAGGRSQGGVSDEEFIRFVAVLALALPDCKIVLTTRESREIQHKLVPIVHVLSAGSASVTPYTESGARFPLETSQFEVLDQRPSEEILREHGEIDNFQPPA
jgi:3-methyl-2-indolic acid synthase